MEVQCKKTLWELKTSESSLMESPTVQWDLSSGAWPCYHSRYRRKILWSLWRSGRYKGSILKCNRALWFFFFFFNKACPHEKLINQNLNCWMSFPGGTSGKEPVCQYRIHRRHGFYPWIREIPGGGHGNPLRYSCLENPTDRGAWRAQCTGSWRVGSDWVT